MDYIKLIGNYQVDPYELYISQRNFQKLTYKREK